MRRSFKIVKMDLTQHEKTVGNHGNMREVYIVHGQVLQLPDSGNMLRVPTMAGCSYPDSSVLHQQSTDLCLGELIFLEFRVWLIRSLVIVMRIDAGMTFISNKSMVFGFFRNLLAIGYSHGTIMSVSRRFLSQSILCLGLLGLAGVRFTGMRKAAFLSFSVLSALSYGYVI